MCEPRHGVFLWHTTYWDHSGPGAIPSMAYAKQKTTFFPNSKMLTKLGQPMFSASFQVIHHFDVAPSSCHIVRISSLIYDTITSLMQAVFDRRSSYRPLVDVSHSEI